MNESNFFRFILNAKVERRVDTPTVQFLKAEMETMVAIFFRGNEVRFGVMIRR